VEGALPPRPILERTRRRIHGLMRTVDGCYLHPRYIDVELDAGTAEWPRIRGEELRLGRAEEDS